MTEKIPAITVDKIRAEIDFVTGSGLLFDSNQILIDLEDLKFDEVVCSFENNPESLVQYIEDNTTRDVLGVVQDSVMYNSDSERLTRKLIEAVCVRVFVSTVNFCRYFQIVRREAGLRQTNSESAS